jgi:Phosphotransferase enzyme family
VASRPAPELALAEACAKVGLDANGARVIYARSNTVYRLAGRPVVVRLRYAPGSAEWMTRIAASVAVTSWLASQAFPTVRPLDVGQPVTARGYIVTFWLYVPRVGKQSRDIGVLGRLLRQLHSLPDPPVRLPTAKPLGSVCEDTQRCDWLADAQRSWLLARCSELERQYAETPWTLGRGLLHGDAYTENLIPTRGGAVLADWDGVSHGPREQDLAPLSIGYRFGRPSSEWDRLCQAYGVEPRGLAGLPVLQQMRELRTLGGYLRAAGHLQARAEAAQRIADLMTGTQKQPWHALNLAS